MKALKFILTVVIIHIIVGFAFAQKSGSIWVKSNKPGSANFNDATIDKETITFLDSLMQRDDIVVTFLGGADKLKWKGLSENSQISSAIDQAKKLERALSLRNKYGKGEVGITDEPVRGVKVVWAPKPPDAFKMRDDIDILQAMNDSLLNLIENLDKNQNDRFAKLCDSMKTIMADNSTAQDEIVEPVYSDWEIKTGMLAWSGGAQYDLAVPSIGLSLKRKYWAFELGGGFTPWSKQDAMGQRGDAMILGTIAILPRRTIAYHVGAFSGWEFFTKTDNWTMKVLGVTAGPSIKFRFFEVFLGYSFSRLSTLTNADQWNSGLFLQFNLKFIIN